MSETATLAAGCFWGVEETFRTTPGVLATAVGYTGGVRERPTYQQVCSGATGHAEAVRVEFDPEVISYAELLAVFWGLHDPTTPNRQGPDVGTQYRSAIFTHSSEQEAVARASREAEERSGRHRGSIVTEIVPAGAFWPAEDYHQQYYAKRGIRGCRL
jgi:peptide-methionine (S)-S-oxide reductase